MATGYGTVLHIRRNSIGSIVFAKQCLAIDFLLGPPKKEPWELPSRVRQLLDGVRELPGRTRGLPDGVLELQDRPRELPGRLHGQFCLDVREVARR